ncbi:isonitrile hydratase 1 [Rhizobium sp. CIAT894]|uniref:DJ-1/PfpI family protein n=1 Tax=Rhizobium sp. CIAT894 TaxID=2020312 RepID=UPI000A1DBDB1|nr:DJ-1/PfpI family protein [Rhizobium sp. CIAT894]ARM88132.1 isonitrile hydratase 1 [Rhizobium sp. CIAT894]
MADSNAFDQSKVLNVGMVLYPNFTLLDLAGPHAALGMHGKTHLLWKTLDPVWTDTGISINPTTTFADAPADLDVIFVPGGHGTGDAMRDQDILEFLAQAGWSARFITSVCTGSLLLAKAGLLKGHRAATHWAFYDALEAMGIEASHDRVVVDGNRYTGGGVTAGIDFGLTLLAALKGEATAKFTQLAMEYDPQPPFTDGHPRTADPLVVQAARMATSEMNQQFVESALAETSAVAWI